jgi:phage gp45-like
MMNGLTRATLVEADDAGTQQVARLRGMRGEDFTKVYRAQPHGLSSNPPVGSEGLLLRMAESERVLAIGFEAKDSRPRNVPSGGTVLYDAQGNVIKLLGSSVEQDFAARPYTIRCGVLTVEASELVLKAGATIIRIRSGRIDLGAMAAPHRVATEAGFSSTVYAVL